MPQELLSSLVGKGPSRVLGNRAGPDIPWLAEVSGRPREEVGSVLKDLKRHREPLRGLSTKILETGRAYYAQFPAPLDLYALVRLAAPESVVESGVASGISTTFILLGLEDNGKGTLQSIDLPVVRAGKHGNESWAIPQGMKPGWAIPHGLERRWRLHIGRSEEILKPLLSEVGGLDFYCHDSPVDVKHFAFEMLAIRSHLGPGSVVVADNTDWTTFESAAKGMGGVAIRRKGSSLGGFRVPTPQRSLTDT